MPGRIFRLDEALIAAAVLMGEPPETTQALARFTALATLSATGCGLTTLEGFPRLPALRVLLLAENRVADGLRQLAAAAPGLEKLDLANNRIARVEELAPLAALPNLAELDVEACPVCQIGGYREAVFKARAHPFFSHSACDTRCWEGGRRA